MDQIEPLAAYLQDSPIFVRLIEQGAGHATANFLYAFAGSSRTVYSSESYYSLTAFERRFPELPECRAVSRERLQAVIRQSAEIQEDLKEGRYNTVFLSSFQLDSHAHGWICLVGPKCRDGRYYHVTLPEGSRQELLPLIGLVGLKILHQSVDLSDSFIDQIWEGDQPDVRATLQVLASNGEEHLAAFEGSGFARMRDLCRNQEALLVFKGSFNPPTSAHLYMMQNTVELLREQVGLLKACWMISVNTYDKGDQPVDSLVQRIQWLTGLGYPVIIGKHPKFVQNLGALRRVFGGQLVFVCGEDTIDRLMEDYWVPPYSLYDKEKLAADFGDAQIWHYHRDQTFFPEDSPNLRSLGRHSYMDVSSSRVRAAMEAKDRKTLENLLPAQVFSSL